jgi:hypothetical protein
MYALLYDSMLTENIKRSINRCANRSVGIVCVDNVGERECRTGSTYQEREDAWLGATEVAARVAGN